MKSPFALALLVVGLALSHTGNAADVQVYEISKGLHYRQLPGRSPTNLTDNGYVFHAAIQMSAPGTVFDATVTSRQGTPRTLVPVSNDRLEFTNLMDLRRTLQTRYPDGAFTFSIDTENDGHRVVLLPLVGAAYPPAPFIHDLVELQAVNANGYSVISWEPFLNGNDGDSIQLRLEHANGDLLWERRFEGDAKRVIIRPGELQPVSTYTATLRFEKFVSRDSTNYPGALGLASYYSQTRFSIATTDDNAPDVERYELSKGRSLEQEDTGDPDPDDEDFIFRARVEAREPGLVTAASVTTPLGPVFPLTPDLQREEFEFSSAASEDLTIEALFPPGNYVFDINTATDGNLLVGLWFDENNYPPEPHLRFDPAQEVSPDSPLVLAWDPWLSGTADDFIQVRLEDEDSGALILESPDFDEPGALDGRATSFVVPAGILRSGVDYEARLTFRRFNRLNWFDYPGALGVSSVFATTRFDIETTRPDLEEYSIARGRGFQQQGAAPPVPDPGDEFIFEAEVEASDTNAILSATLTTPPGVTVPLTPNNDGDEFDYSDTAPTEAAFDAEYPPGDYRFDVVGRRGPLSVVLNVPDAPYPPAPTIHLSTMPEPEPDQPFTISWDAWSGATTNDFIQVRIQDDDSGNTVFETPDRGDPGALDGTATSVTIPINVFRLGRDYEGRVTFERIVRVDEDTLPGAEGTVTYFSRTDFDFEAAGPDVEEYSIERGRRYDQLTDAPPVPREGDEFVFNAEVQGSAPNLITSATLTTPPGDIIALDPNNDRDEWEFTDDRSTEAAFNSRYPPGRYVFNVQSVNDGTTTLPLDAPATDYPPAPHLQFDPRNPVDATRPTVVRWNPWVGGTAEDFIQLRIEDTEDNVIFETPDRGDPGALNGLSTSVTIPAGELQPEQTYDAQIFFERNVLIDETTLPGAEGRVTYFARTDFPLRTAAMDVEDYHIERGRRYDQVTSAAPVPRPGDEFVFNAEVQSTAPNRITSATLVTPPGSVVTLAPNSAGDEWEFSDDTSTEQEFETQYPSGAYRFIVQGVNQGTQTLPLTVPPSAYPPAPHVLFNPESSVDPSQQLVLSWDPWVGATTNDFIQVRVEDDLGSVVFETPDRGGPGALNGLSTSTAIPPFTFALGRTYDARVIFERIVLSDETSVPGAEGRVTYFARTDFPIETTGPDVEDYRIERGRRYEQTTAGLPVPDPGDEFVFNAEVQGSAPNLIQAAALTTPFGGAGTVALQPDKDRDEFEYSAQASTEPEFEAQYPAGQYFFTVQTVNQGTQTLPLFVPSSLYPPAPHVQFDPNTEVAAHQPLVLTWDPWFGAGANDFIQVRVEDEAGAVVFETPDRGDPSALDGTATSVTIPAGTLIPGQVHGARVVFERIVLSDTTTLPGAEGRVTYFARTDFDILTVDPDVREYEVFKERVYSQTSSSEPVLTGFAFRAAVEAEDDNTVISASIITPTSNFVQLAQGGGGDEFELVDTRPSQAALDADYPDGGYVLVLDTVNEGVRNVPFSLTNALYPSPPQLSNFDAAQNINTMAPFTLTWFPFAGGTTADHIDVQIEDSEGNELFDTPGFGNEGALNGTATSVTIPPFTLPAGRTFEARILFQKILRADDVGYPGVTGPVGYSTRTFVPVATAPIGAAPLIQNYRVLADGRLQFNVATFDGAAYEIQGSTNLIDWTPLGTLSAASNPSTFTAPAPPSPGACFYRAVSISGR